MHAKVGLVDHGIRPCTRQEILLGHGLAGALDEGEKDLHRPAAQATDLAAFEQDALRGDQPERAECQCMSASAARELLIRACAPERCGDLAPDPAVRQVSVGAPSRGKNETPALRRIRRRSGNRTSS